MDPPRSPATDPDALPLDATRAGGSFGPSRGPSRGASDPLRLLVARLAAGDERALRRLHEATAPRVVGLAFRVLRDRADAEEVAIEVYAQAWRQAPRFDPERGTVTAWLLALARTRAIDRLRRERTHGARTESLEAVDERQAEHPGPAERAQANERAARVTAAVRALPAAQRRALEAAYFGGLSHTEVAAAFGEPLGTVKTRIRAALATLRRALERSDGPDDPRAGEEPAAGEMPAGEIIEPA